ncbi:DUF421 domain-containing protein [Pradoshia sp.]
MDYFYIIGRTFFLYVLIFLVFRIMGKREIGELSLLDLVVFIMIADIAVIGIENYDETVLNAVLPIIILFIIQMTVAFASLKIPFLRKAIDGEPTVLIHQGYINQKAMRKLRYNMDDLLMQLRENGVRKISRVEFGIVEASGKLSVYEFDENENSSQVKPAPIITLVQDGKAMKDTLNGIGKSEGWLMGELERYGHPDIKGVFLCTLEDDQLRIFKKE